MTLSVRLAGTAALGVLATVPVAAATDSDAALFALRTIGPLSTFDSGCPLVELRASG